ncbi:MULTISPECIES: HAMP domain-containing sensor histidine kinase [unclassified Breznakia]|uniref:sensor histidine kinase n=1 Tax=unclassified Breznakia TaxID=2623764 RepID=UPI0024061602|nr:MULTISPECIES: HAMP domain-containing sensor histidine kinase [unclassified Breznakia]MDF9838772.1 signal transduction histidine kinase [Breznakia sp. PFB2-8]MDF9860798.1 signal transduction histidine kinase [Breznakia sp. PH5-24]
MIRWIKEKGMLLGYGLLLVGIVIYGLMYHNLILIFASIAITAYGIIMILVERNTMQKELNELSIVIDQMINQEKIKIGLLNDEYMSSKIHHQLEKVNTLFISKQEEIEKDRDEIRLLINDIAHQMRTPLANMKLYLELLEKEELNQEQQEYIESVEKAMQTMSFLSENFIRMSRIEGKIIQLKLNKQSLTLTIREAILSMNDFANSKNIQLCFDEKNTYELFHDFQWMKEALVNIIDNAIKYSSENEEIYISINENDMFTQIQIEDNGIGIDIEEEAVVFKRFYRGNRVSNQKGFGLGLYITRMIVQAHEGYIKVKRKEKGTIFLVVLPK